MRHYSAAQTREALPFPALVEALARTAQDYADGTVRCPERSVVPAPGGSTLLLTMPAVSQDLLVTKLLTFCPDNASTSLPTIQGQVLCASARTGELLFSLDGPTVTMRRTSAISLLAIRLLAHGPVRRALMIGTGTQARAHCEAFAALYPDSMLAIRGRTPERAASFCQQQADLPIHIRPEHPQEDPFDVVLTVTNSRTVLYDEAPSPECLVIGVGAFQPDMIEVGPRIVRNSALYVDDLAGAPGEAGELIQAGIDWNTVQPLAAALRTPPPNNQPIFFKSVGCAAWDLAACRVLAPQPSP
ncbi:delta(1)-pyrroline-2-carboxylate reductase family protein [Acetobacter orleanensis]|uniref:Ornithine cyclodeaminase n=1 Tax=Acetobacter orleanensis TaxID=104099 RepID=A0A4Y3TPK7_9PROT|nr:delta(1)-pyrroline-2-carboxylate reductase family protein [Acetobacter orleanensis]KXV66334.1 ornithine cyclodeaminase [Acetobacter orleanensis]PCD78544.1 ornithine cyclodeaminase [Acetobacter orleanensis]GAN69175.1 ornithine cyclodeaminase [Acetobacter orleanensis JCM 7639]GBR29365.1 ornithine cyclodeaminase [Acetobacter orleanensis NRIC 0473]GEB83762.1 ornithine cyclodeaminase [Acetobacter orleanensis]